MSKEDTKFMFFTGKGGVGKTSLACANAVKIADDGKKVLLISTDPASNLEDVLETSISQTIAQHKKIPNLYLVNIDPEKAAEEYRERVITPLKETVSDKEVQRIEEGLSGACTTEIASFDEFSRFVTGEGSTEIFDAVIFDTAPTGHTIRLLELPAAWDTYLEKNPQGASCIGPSSALMSSKERYKKVIATLKDSDRTIFNLVARCDVHSLKEAARTSLEMKSLGFTNQELLINGVFAPIYDSDPLANEIARITQKNLSSMPDVLQNLKRKDYPLLPYNILGLEKLRSIFDKQKQDLIIKTETKKAAILHSEMKGIKELVDELEGTNNSGLIMTMGKGGVDKTIVAATIATLLAERGHKVLLTTTDPAAHVNDFISQLEEKPKNLTVERIDPKLETKNYTDKILRQKGTGLDAEAKALLIEDLKSPCSEEVAVFNAFSKAINKAKRQFVVMDTAPTGHTLLLLDTTGSYHKEIMKTTKLDPNRISTPYMSLQDSEFAKILLVALPETTPMREAVELQNDLKRAGIEPYSWVINQSLSLVDTITDPILSKRAEGEIDIINQIEEQHARDTFFVPFVAEEKLLPAILKITTF
jgi:arsenite-transporting ATPase